MRIKTIVSIAAAAVALSLGAGVAVAYDGTKCKAAGVCWEPKPGFPEKVAGSKYDPKHNPTEVAKQQTALDDQAERNKKRAENFKKTGKWVYDVKKIQ
jgi:methanol dehydrogenase (cytochrome c) subunit 2